MTIELQMVSLAVVVPLYHLSRVVDILGIQMPDILYKDSRWVRLQSYFSDILMKVSIQLFVPLFKVVPLVKGNDAQSLWMGGKLYKGFYCVKKLHVTV